MAKKTESPEVKQVENVEDKKVDVEIGEVNIMPNWENTPTWLHVCSQLAIALNKKKGESVTVLLKNIDKTKTDIEKFSMYSLYADKRMKQLDEMKESFKSMKEIADYQVHLLSLKKVE